MKLKPYQTLIAGFILGSLSFILGSLIRSRMSIVSILAMPPYMVARLPAIVTSMVLYGALGALVFFAGHYLYHLRKRQV